MKSYKDSRIFWLLKNICSFFRMDIYRDVKQLYYENEILKGEISSMRWQCDRLQDQCTILALKNKMFAYFEDNPEYAERYKEELFCIKHTEELLFPYKRIKVLTSVEKGFDSKKKLPFVIHNGKKLFFPQKTSLDICEKKYKSYIESENICGGDFLEKCPHCYQSDKMRIDENDVLVDVGCAEALLSLDVIDRVKKVYLIESNVSWVEALKATFEPYKEKTVFINKKVSGYDGDNTIKLSTLLKEEKASSIFIKMDIEGYEEEVIRGSLDFIHDRSGLKFACCTYHKEKDAENLRILFDKCGYNIEFSDGYMVFYYDKLNPPFFRKGVIRAWR